MIIRECRIIECFCECGSGQVQDLLQHVFEKKISINEMIDKIFVCKKCGKENVIEDIIELIPLEFIVSSSKDVGKMKVNSELKKYLES